MQIFSILQLSAAGVTVQNLSLIAARGNSRPMTRVGDLFHNATMSRWMASAFWSRLRGDERCFQNAWVWQVFWLFWTLYQLNENKLDDHRIVLKFSFLENITPGQQNHQHNILDVLTLKMMFPSRISIKNSKITAESVFDYVWYKELWSWRMMM